MAARLRALGRIGSGDVTQAAQTEDGMFALEWTRQGEAVLLKLDGRLQIVDRRSVFQGGPVDLDRLLLDRERDGHLTAHPVRSGPPEDGEALEVEWLQGESDFSCERRAGVI
jgi:hypothetical protein